MAVTYRDRLGLRVGALLRDSITYLWHVRPSYDLPTRLTFPFLFIGSVAVAARGTVGFRLAVLQTGLAVFFAYFGGVMLNDLCDLEIDRLSHPERPLPKGTVSRNNLIAGSILFLLAGEGIAMVFDRAPLILGLIIAMTVLHYTVLKRGLRMPGSSVVITSGIVAMLGPHGVMAAHSSDYPLMFGLGALLLFGTLASNLLNGVEDREAEAGNVANLGEIWSDSTCVGLAAACTALAVVAGVAVWSVRGRSVPGAILLGISAVYGARSYLRLLSGDLRSEVRGGVLAAAGFLGLTMAAMFATALF